MEIVIDIPNFKWLENEEDFKTAVKEYEQGTRFDKEIRNALLSGTPLPKHHGRIIDESKINKVYVYTEEAIANNIKAIGTIITGTDAPTIIEADKGVLEKINEKQDSLRATCKAWDEATEKDGYVD